MHLAQLRKQAKELVRAARAGDAAALARLAGREPILARAQLVIAREHGFASWPALVLSSEAGAESFIRAATEGRRRRAEALLAARPEIGRDPWARLVLGRGWDGDPAAPGGPRGWTPLHYVANSVFASVELARDLIARGADVNATYPSQYGPQSVLYGAAGVIHHPGLTRLLLEAGADPDDDESLYHAAGAQDPACLALLLEHGARTSGTNALGHALDYDRLEPVRLLLEAGFPHEEAAHVAHAVRRGRGPEFIRLLAAHGADLDRLGGETWRGDVPLRTPYQHAVLRGREDVAATLAELGARTEVAPDDVALGRIARGERPEAVPVVRDVDGQEVVIVAALSGLDGLIVELFGPDFAGVVGGSPEGTLLHHAAWVADAPLAERLLAAGADPRALSPAEYSTPLAWAALASGDGGRDHLPVAELLLAAGAEVEPRLLDVADGPLAERLAEVLGASS